MNAFTAGVLGNTQAKVCHTRGILSTGQVAPVINSSGMDVKAMQRSGLSLSRKNRLRNIAKQVYQNSIGNTKVRNFLTVIICVKLKNCGTTSITYADMMRKSA